MIFSTFTMLLILYFSFMEENSAEPLLKVTALSTFLTSLFPSSGTNFENVPVSPETKSVSEKRRKENNRMPQFGGNSAQYDSLAFDSSSTEEPMPDYLSTSQGWTSDQASVHKENEEINYKTIDDIEFKNFEQRKYFREDEEISNNHNIIKRNAVMTILCSFFIIIPLYVHMVYVLTNFFNKTKRIEKKVNK
jgi:hypothetical protein